MTMPARHSNGTILAFFDQEQETWSFAVVACRCVNHDGCPRKRHSTLNGAEECAMRTIRGPHLRLAAAQSTG